MRRHRHALSRPCDAICAVLEPSAVLRVVALRAVLQPHTAVNALEHVHRPDSQHSHIIIGNELAEADAGQRDAADEAKPRRVMLVVSATHRAATS